jgi:hypothetical protein
MKHALGFGLVTSLLALGASDAYAEPPAPTATSASSAHAHAHAHARKGKKKAVKVALSAAKPVAVADLIAKPDAPAAAPADERPRASYWLAADPHVPLAAVEGKAIRSIGKRGKDCGEAARWASPKSRWHAVDAYGRPTGLFELAGSETFDLTACHEVSFTARAGKPGVGLFVSEDSGYSPAESAAFSPSAPEKRHFERFLGAMESSWVNQKPLGKAVPWAKRTLFFQFAPPRDPGLEGRVDGAGKPLERPRRWAVVGGPILVVAYLGEHDHWKATTVKLPLGLADSYTPVAVFDMNGDGIPEIVVRASDGPTFAERVLGLDPETMTWSEAAQSPGGAAL